MQLEPSKKGVVSGQGTSDFLARSFVDAFGVIALLKPLGLVALGVG